MYIYKIKLNNYSKNNWGIEIEGCLLKAMRLEVKNFDYIFKDCIILCLLFED